MSGHLNFYEEIEEAGLRLIRKSVVELPSDIKEALAKAYNAEKEEVGRLQLKAILDNSKLAEHQGVPICQDTGILYFYVRLGKKPLSLVRIGDALAAATRKATVSIPLRSNAVHPFSRKNSGDNTGLGIPIVDWDASKDEYLEITALPKGAGSENRSAFRSLLPSDGIAGVKEFVIETVIKAGGGPCPPSVVGIGVGGSPDLAMKLSKRALLRPIGLRHQDPEIAKLEEELLAGINATGIGPSGLGGSTTSLGVNAELAFCHTASLPVGVNIQCWAARKASARIYEDGHVVYL